MAILKTLKYYGYFRKHPYFYPRFAAEKFLQTFTPRRRVLLSEICFESRCNFNCWHCSSLAYTKNGKPPALTFEQLKLIVRKLRSVGVLSASYVGGEPLLRADLPRLIRMTNSHGILPSLITNGYLLTEAKTDELFDAGLANMGFSLQSMDPEKHDRLVGRKSAHARIMWAIQYCVDNKYTISVCLVPTNENLVDGDFDDMVQFATERGLRVNVNLPAPIGRLMNDCDCLLTEQSLKQLADRYFRLPNFLPDFKQTSISTKLRCPMGENSIYILPTGDVCPCTFIHVSFGNILKEPMSRILQRLDASPTLNGTTRDSQCPVAMNREFIGKLTTAITGSTQYPPLAEEVCF